jgi:hypothetical protein
LRRNHRKIYGVINIMCAVLKRSASENRRSLLAYPTQIDDRPKVATASRNRQIDHRFKLLLTIRISQIKCAITTTVKLIDKIEKVGTCTSLIRVCEP